MNPDQLREYKRDKSKKFNAKMRDLRLREKKRISDNQPDQQPDQQPDNTIDKQEKQDELSLQDVMDIFETLDTKMDIIQTKLETIMENKLYEPLETKLDLIDNKLETIMENKLYEPLDTKMDIIQNKLETIMENKLYEPLETNTPLPQFKPIFFA
jgi:mevalonate kinase